MVDESVYSKSSRHRKIGEGVQTDMWGGLGKVYNGWVVQERERDFRGRGIDFVCIT